MAFQRAVAIGVHGVELDVRLTRDGRVVVMHDPTVDRTTDGRGEVALLSWDALRRLDAGARFSPDHGGTFPHAGAGLGVPLLADVLEALPATPLIVEVKVVEAARDVARVILDHGAAARCTIGAFAHETLRQLVGSGIARSASTREALRCLGPALLGHRYHHAPFEAMSLPRFYRGVPVPLGALARSMEPAGVPVLAWTINEAARARRLWDLGLRGVLTDDPGTLLAARA